MSVYVSADPGIVDDEGTVVDVALGVDDVRLGVWIEKSWAPCAYLTPDQARTVAVQLIAAADRVELVGMTS